MKLVVTAGVEFLKQQEDHYQWVRLGTPHGQPANLQTPDDVHADIMANRSVKPNAAKALSMSMNSEPEYSREDVAKQAQVMQRIRRINEMLCYRIYKRNQILPLDQQVHCRKLFIFKLLSQLPH